jgi:hypothetical protein
VIQPVRITRRSSAAGRELTLADLAVPLPLDFPRSGSRRAAAAARPWEVELGCRQGPLSPAPRERGPRHALPRRRGGQRVLPAGGAPRARRRGLGNLVVLRAEALFLLSAVLPAALRARRPRATFPIRGRSSAIRSGAFSIPRPSTLVLGLLAPDGELFFRLRFPRDTASWWRASCARCRDSPSSASPSAGRKDRAHTTRRNTCRQGRPIVRLARTVRRHSRAGRFLRAPPRGQGERPGRRARRRLDLRPRQPLGRKKGQVLFDGKVPVPFLLKSGCYPAPAMRGLLALLPCFRP